MESNKADDINAEKEVDDMSIAALDEKIGRASCRERV